LKLTGRIWTLEALGAWVRKRVQKRDEHVVKLRKDPTRQVGPDVILTKFLERLADKVRDPLVHRRQIRVWNCRDMGKIRDVSVLKGHCLVSTQLVIRLKVKPQPEVIGFPPLTRSAGFGVAVSFEPSAIS
jgi:hypothetical protein